MNVPELVCPAGTYAALQAAVDHGAEAVYVGLRNGTNARNFPGLNFTGDELRSAVKYAHAASVRVFLTLNTYAQPGKTGVWTAAADLAAETGLDAIIAADPGVLAYCARQHPDLDRHLSVQASATSVAAIRFYAERFCIRRVILPRVLSLAQIEHLVPLSPVEVEVFGYGSLCVMVEGRCILSSYATGVSPNMGGACSPASAVRWHETSSVRSVRLNGVLIDRFAPLEQAGYPTLCKGRFTVEGKTVYALEEPTSLNVLSVLGQLARAGVRGIKIEGRQRSPAYIARVTEVMRAALDALKRDGDAFVVRDEWRQALDSVSEGRQQTLGALHRHWQ